MLSLICQAPFIRRSRPGSPLPARDLLACYSYVGLTYCGEAASISSVRWHPNHHDLPGQGLLTPNGGRPSREYCCVPAGCDCPGIAAGSFAAPRHLDR